jgi:hypothetical protein
LGSFELRLHYINEEATNSGFSQLRIHFAERKKNGSCCYSTRCRGARAARTLPYTPLQLPSSCSSSALPFNSSAYSAQQLETVKKIIIFLETYSDQWLLELHLICLPKIKLRYQRDSTS